MFYTAKNSKILLNNTGMYIQNANLDISSFNDPIYLSEDKEIIDIMINEMLIYFLITHKLV